MKRVLAVSLLLLLVLAAPAAAALKMLPDAQAQELEGLALEYLASETGIDVEELEVSEGWVRELRALELDIYMVVILHDDDKFMVAVHVEEKLVLSDDELEALVAEDIEKTPEDAVYTLNMPVDTTEEGTDEEAGDRDLRTVAYWAAGAVILLGLGTAMVKVRK